MPHCLASLAANVSRMQRWELARTRHAAHSHPFLAVVRNRNARISIWQHLKEEDFYWGAGTFFDHFVSDYKVPDSSSATFGGGGVKSP